MAEREDDDVALVALNRFEGLDEGALVHALAGERGAVVCIEGGVRFAAAVEGIEDGLALLAVEGDDAEALAGAVDHQAGDEVDDPAAKGNWVIKASNKQRPRIVDANSAEILDELEVYGGCYVRASLNAKAYGTSQKGGVTLELNVVQKVADGTPFGGAAKAMTDAVNELGAYEGSGEDW